MCLARADLQRMPHKSLFVLVTVHLLPVCPAPCVVVRHLLHTLFPGPQLSLAAGVGLRFIVDLEAGKPALRLEHVLRVVDSLGGEFTLNGFASNHSGTAPTADNAHDARAARLRALDELTAQARELKMGYE